MARVPAARARAIFDAALKAKSVEEIAQLSPDEVVRLAYEALESRKSESSQGIAIDNTCPRCGEDYVNIGHPMRPGVIMQRVCACRIEVCPSGETTMYIAKPPTEEERTAFYVKYGIAKRAASDLKNDAKKHRFAAISYVTRADEKILCVWNKRYRGWSMPGGLVEDGESIEAGQARELREETSLVTIDRERIYEGPVKRVLSIDETRGSFVVVYRVAVGGIAREMEEGCPVTWFTRDEFLNATPFAEFYDEMFKKLASTKSG